MNSAVLTSYVIKNGTYEGSAERLVDFWKYLSKESISDTNPWFKPSWDYLHSDFCYMVLGNNNNNLPNHCRMYRVILFKWPTS
jgi:hypothetical protein